MKSKLKVYGLTGLNDAGRQQRCVVAVSTQMAAAKALGCTLHHLRGYGSITGNEAEVKLALENPGKAVFVGDPL